MAVVAVAVEATVAGSGFAGVALPDAPVSLGAPAELEDPDELDADEGAGVGGLDVGWVTEFPFASASGSTYC